MKSYQKNKTQKLRKQKKNSKIYLHHFFSPSFLLASEIVLAEWTPARMATVQHIFPYNLDPKVLIFDFPCVRQTYVHFLFPAMSVRQAALNPK